AFLRKALFRPQSRVCQGVGYSFAFGETYNLVCQLGSRHAGTVQLTVNIDVPVRVHREPKATCWRRISIVQRPPSPPFCRDGEWFDDMNIPAKLPEHLASKHIPVTVTQGPPLCFRQSGKDLLILCPV